jgi:DNA polymerase
MTIPLFLDTETYCETPINNGMHKYAEAVEVIMWQWAVGDGEVVIRDYDEPIDDLLALLADPQYEIVIHNSAFDRTVMRHSQGIVISVDRIFDTMVCAMTHSLPGALATLCGILGVPTDKAKDKEGKTWINLFCKPQPKGRKLRRATKHSHPIEWQRFRDYGGLDIVAMREVYKRLPRWNYRDEERALWALDQRINDRGVTVDVDLATAAIRASTRAQDAYAVETLERTDGAVASTNQRDKLIAHILEAYGVSLPDMTSSTLERRVDDPDLPQPLRELLAIRLQASKTSVSKYKRVVNGVSIDGRLRGLLQFAGALRTCRWAGRLFQPQNLPRPTLDNTAIERGIEAMKANAEDLV